MITVMAVAMDRTEVATDRTEVDMASSTTVAVDTDPMEDMVSSIMEVADMEATDTVNCSRRD